LDDVNKAIKEWQHSYKLTKEKAIAKFLVDNAEAYVPSIKIVKEATSTTVE